jgi:hypothetical protein
VESWRTAIHHGTAEEQGWPRWLNVPSKVAQVAAVRAVATQRRAADLAAGTLVAAACPGLVDTRASRPWFDDYSRAQTPKQAARAVLDLILADRPDPATYGELVQFGQVLPWHSGTPFPTRTRCSAGRTGRSAPLAMAGELPAPLRSAKPAAAAAGRDEADGQRRKAESVGTQ